MDVVLTPERMADDIASFAARAPLTEGILTPFGVIDPSLLSQDRTLDLGIGIERTKNWLDAQQMRNLAWRAAHPEPVPYAPPGLGSHYAVLSLQQEVACANRWSANTAADRIQTAVALVEKLPATLDLMETGALSYGYAHVLVAAVDKLDDPTGKITAKLEERVLKRAASQTYGEFRAAVRRGVAALDPRGAEEKHAADAQDRRVFGEPADNSMTWIKAFLTAADAQTVLAAVQAIADKLAHKAKLADPTEDRTADQFRADALTTICAAVLNGDVDTLADLGLPRWQGRRPNVDLVIALSTLLGEDDQPGELAGYGPIPASLAQLIASDPSATWRRMLTDQTGTLIDYGQTRYRPPADLRDFITTRNRTCTGIGCHRNSHRCDEDHDTDFTQGGSTSTDNLSAKCQREHYLKQFANWRSHRHPDGTIQWTTPTGRTYDKPPDPLPEDRTRPKTEPETPEPDEDPPPF